MNYQNRGAFGHKQYPLLQVITQDIKINDYSVPLHYQFPLSFKECYSLDYKWHVPVLLSVFKDLRIVLKLLTYMLLEKSLIFVSKDPATLSSVILGLIALMKPFNWCYTFATNLPAAMLGILDSPIPMIVGISHEMYASLREDENYDEDLIESKTWVFLD